MNLVVLSLLQTYCLRYDTSNVQECTSSDKHISYNELDKIIPENGWYNITIGQEIPEQYNGKVIFNLNKYYESKIKIRAVTEVILEFTPGLLHLDALYAESHITVNFTNNKDITIKELRIFQLPILNENQNIMTKRLSGPQYVLDPVIQYHLVRSPHHVALFIDNPTFISFTEKGVRYISLEQNSIFNDAPFPEFEVLITSKYKIALNVEEDLTRRKEYIIRSISNNMVIFMIPGKHWIDKELPKDFRIRVETHREIRVEHELGIDKFDEDLLISPTRALHLYSNFAGIYGFYQPGLPFNDYYIKASLKNPSDFGFMYIPREENGPVRIYFSKFDGGSQSFDFDHIGQNKIVEVRLEDPNDVLYCVFRPNTTYKLYTGNFIASPIDWSVSNIVVDNRATFSTVEGMTTEFHINNLTINNKYNIVQINPTITADLVHCTDAIFDQASQLVSQKTNFEVELSDPITGLTLVGSILEATLNRNTLFRFQLNTTSNLTLFTHTNTYPRIINMKKANKSIEVIPNIVIKGNGSSIINFDESWDHFHLPKNKLPFIAARENATVYVRTTNKAKIPKFYTYENISFNTSKIGSYCTSHTMSFNLCDLDSILIDPVDYQNKAIPIQMNEKKECKIGVIDSIKLNSTDVNGGNLTIYAASRNSIYTTEIDWVPKNHPRELIIINTTVRVLNNETFGLRTLKLIGNAHLILDNPNIKVNTLETSITGFLSINQYLHSSDYRSVILNTPQMRDIYITINPYSIVVGSATIPYNIYESLTINTSRDVVIDNGCIDHTVIPHVFDIYIAENRSIKFTGKWKYANLYKGAKFREGKIYLGENATCLDGIYNPLFNTTYHTHYRTTVLATGEDFGPFEQFCNVSKNVIFFNNVSSLTQSPAFSFKCRHYLLINTTKQESPYFSNLFVDDKTVVLKSWKQGYATMHYGCVPKRLLLIDTILTIESDSNVKFDWLELRGNSDIICQSKVFANDFIGPLDFKPHIMSAVLTEPNIIIDSLNESVIDNSTYINNLIIYDDYFELEGNKKFRFNYRNFMTIKITRYIKTATLRVTFMGTLLNNSNRMPEIHFMYQKKPQVIFDSTFNKENFSFKYPLKFYWMKEDEVDILTEKMVNIYGVVMNTGNIQLKPLRICVGDIKVSDGCAHMNISGPISRTIVDGWHSSHVEIYAKMNNSEIEFLDGALEEVDLTLYLEKEQILKIEPNSYVQSLHIYNGSLIANQTVFKTLHLEETTFVNTSMIEVKNLHIPLKELSQIQHIINESDSMQYFIHTDSCSSITVSNSTIILANNFDTFNLTYPKSDGVHICLDGPFRSFVELKYDGDLHSNFDQPLAFVGASPGVVLRINNSWEQFDSSRRRILLKGYIITNFHNQKSINARSAFDSTGVLA